MKIERLSHANSVKNDIKNCYFLIPSPPHPPLFLQNLFGSCQIVLVNNSYPIFTLREYHIFHFCEQLFDQISSLRICNFLINNLHNQFHQQSASI